MKYIIKLQFLYWKSHRSLLGNSDRSNNYNSSPLSASTSSEGSTSSFSHQQHQRFNPFLTSPTASTSRHGGPSGPSAAFLRVNDPSLRDDVDDVVRMRSGQAEFVSSMKRPTTTLEPNTDMLSIRL